MPNYKLYPDNKIVKIKPIPKKELEEARNKIIAYMDKYNGAYTSELIKNLKIDPIVAIKVLNALKKEKLLKCFPTDKTLEDTL